MKKVCSDYNKRSRTRLEITQDATVISQGFRGGHRRQEKFLKNDDGSIATSQKERRNGRSISTT